MTPLPESDGPFILWCYYPYEGWSPTTYGTVAAAKKALRSDIGSACAPTDWCITEMPVVANQKGEFRE